MEFFDAYAAPVLDFIRAHQAWAAPIVGLLAFAESLAVLSLIVPSTVILVGVGALLGAAGLGPTTGEFWVIFAAATIGAILGDWLSYEFGRYFDEETKRMWPLRNYPEMMAKGEDFVKRWGVPGVFIGRFFGPARAVVPLIAGIFDMPRGPFQLANVSSAAVWALVMLGPAAGLLDLFR